MKKKLILNLFIIFQLLLLGCEKSFEGTVIKLAHSLDQNHPVHKSMVYMSKILEKKSGGDLRIKIYPNEQLGTERECIELLQIGSLGMTKVSASVLESFSPRFKVFSLPYLFRDDSHRYKVLEGEIGNSLLNSLESSLLLGLCYYDAGSRSFYTTKKMIKTPEDLRGLKIRVMQSATAIEMVNALGGSATPIAAGELYTALQQGVIDGAENNFPTFYSSHHYEICKYFSIDEHASIPDVLVISTKVWNKLSSSNQKLLKEAVIESAEYQKKLWQKATTLALEEIKKAGVEVYYPDKKNFVDKVKSMYDNLKGEPENYKLVNEIIDLE